MRRMLIKKISMALSGIVFGVFTVFLIVKYKDSIKGILYPLVISFLLAYLLDYPTVYLEKKLESRQKAVSLVFMVALFLLALTLAITIPRLINDLGKMLANMPHQMQEFSDQIKKINKFTANINPEYSNLSEVVLRQLSNYWQSLVWGVFSRLTSNSFILLKKLIVIIYIPVLVFFMLRDFTLLKKLIKRNISVETKVEISFLQRRLTTVLFGWLKGQLIVCSIIGILVYIGLYLIGIEQKFFLALFSGITNLIPYFGPVIGALPAVATAFSVNSGMVIKVILLYTLIQQIEGNIISPQVFGDRIGLSPAWILVSLVIGGKVYGVIGLILAVPLAGMAKIILEYLGGRKMRYLNEEEIQ